MAPRSEIKFLEHVVSRVGRQCITLSLPEYVVKSCFKKLFVNL